MRQYWVYILASDSRETTGGITAAIAREEQLKAWKRRRKLDLVESMNPEWKDLLP